MKHPSTNSGAEPTKFAGFDPNVPNRYWCIMDTILDEMVSDKAESSCVDRAEAGWCNRRRKKTMFYIFFSVLLMVVAYGLLIEPRWLAIKQIELAEQPTLRLVHISDLHYKGDQPYLQRVVRLANSQEPDFVCITGDFVSNARHLNELLDLLSGLTVPVFAVTGNWDHWAEADSSQISDFCAKSGGKLLVDQTVSLPGYDIAISGGQGKGTDWLEDIAQGRHILLSHYPLFVEQLGQREFDLILAGHSHGGQVRLPVIGSIIVPYDVGKYDLGLFKTPAGPMYVTSGIGMSQFPLRLNCRPEIVVIDL